MLEIVKYCHKFCVFHKDSRNKLSTSKINFTDSSIILWELSTIFISTKKNQTLNFPFFIATRIAINRQKTFSKFIIRLSVTATALSVMTMIITLAFVNGFQKTISEKVFSFWGHIHVQHLETTKSLVAEESPINTSDTIAGILKLQKKVVEINRFATKSAVVEKLKNIEGVLIKGVNKEYNQLHIQPFLKKGKWINFKDSMYSKEVVVSEFLARELAIEVGDTIRIHFISTNDTKESKQRKVLVSGIYKTGIEEYDKLFVLADIRFIQRVNNWDENQIGGYELFLDDYKNMDEISNQISDALPLDWISKSTRDIYPNIFDWLNIQDVNKNVVFIIMSLVAIINLITCLLVLVLERTKMVGILKAVGIADNQLQQIFIFYAFAISILGIGIGAISGIGLCYLQQITHFISLDESAYYVSYAPISIVWWQVVGVCLATTLICFFSLLIPSLIVKRMKPVKAIQFN